MATQRIKLFPNQNKSGDQPDLYIRAVDHRSEKTKGVKDIGAAWLHDSPYGKYYDAELGGQYNDDFWLLSADEYSEYQQLKREAAPERETKGENFVKKPQIEYPDEDITPSSIPF